MRRGILKVVGLLLVTILMMGSGSTVLAASPGGMGGRVITKGTLPDQAKAAATLHIQGLSFADHSLRLQGMVRAGSTQFPFDISAPVYRTQMDNQDGFVAVARDAASGMAVFIRYDTTGGDAPTLTAIRRNDQDLFLVGLQRSADEMVLVEDYAQQMGQFAAAVRDFWLENSETLAIAAPEVDHALVGTMVHVIDKRDAPEFPGDVGIMLSSDSDTETYAPLYWVNGSCWVQYVTNSTVSVDGDSSIYEGSHGHYRVKITLTEKRTDSNCAFYVDDTNNYGYGDAVGIGADSPYPVVAELITDDNGEVGDVIHYIENAYFTNKQSGVCSYCFIAEAFISNPLASIAFSFVENWWGNGTSVEVLQSGSYGKGGRVIFDGSWCYNEGDRMEVTYKVNLPYGLSTTDWWYIKAKFVEIPYYSFSGLDFLYESTEESPVVQVYIQHVAQ